MHRHRLWRHDHIDGVVEPLTILILHSLERVDIDLLTADAGVDKLRGEGRNLQDLRWNLKVDHVDVIQTLQPLQQIELWRLSAISR